MIKFKEEKKIKFCTQYGPNIYFKNNIEAGLVA